jgi:BA14K-like protein
MATRIYVIMLAIIASSSAARAEPQAYCQAYATDFANAQAKDQTTWQHKYDISLQGCLEAAKPEKLAAPAAPIKPAAPPQKIQVPPVQAQAEAVPPEPVAASANGKPAPGSDAWNAYCANKYTSFNQATGMYLSRTGVNRKCVVTNP